MRPRENEYGLYPRKLHNGKTLYYFWFYHENGSRIYRTTHETSYPEALKYVKKMHRSGWVYVTDNQTFSNYFSEFFIYDKCPHIAYVRYRTRTYSKTWAARQRSLLEKVIIPELGDKIIYEINYKMLENWLLSLPETGMNYKTINHIISILKVLFDWVYRRKVIPENPMEGIKPFGLTSKEKGIFSVDEIQTLFATNDNNILWKDKTIFLFNLVAVYTGMRLGEIQALHFSDIQDDYLDVSKSWNRMDGIKSTKTGKKRRVPIPTSLANRLRALQSVDSGLFIFSSTKVETPFDHKSIYKHFYSALDKIGIAKENRKMRNLTFHSFRHTYNTRLLEAGLHPELVRLYTGHMTKEMTYHYAHVMPRKIDDILNIRIG